MGNGLIKKFNGEKLATDCVRVNDGYVIPAPLVHKILWGIVTVLVAIGCYMALWYVDDRVWKSETSARLTAIEFELSEIKPTLDRVKAVERDDIYIKSEVRELKEAIKEQGRRLNTYNSRKTDQ